VQKSSVLILSPTNCGGKRFKNVAIKYGGKYFSNLA
jgi:hypothetical protein